MVAIYETSSVAVGFGRHGMHPPVCNRDLDCLTLKLVCESHLKWGTFVPTLGTFGSRIIRCVRDERTDRQKQRLLRPSLRSGAQ